MFTLPDEIVVGLAGDWHGNTDWARHAIYTFATRGIKTVYHLGDFGLYWPGSYWGRYLNEVEGACTRFGVDIYVTPGNHENYDKLEQQPIADDGLIHVSKHIKVFPRGFRWEQMGRTFVSLGGAPSIDFQFRVVTRSWWKQELITFDDVDRAVEGGNADIMLAHDAPSGGTDEVQRIIDMHPDKTGWSNSALRYCREGRKMLELAFEEIHPFVFAHGHYHVAGEKYTRGTQFLSLDCDGAPKNLIALDLTSFEHTWLEIEREIPR